MENLNRSRRRHILHIAHCSLGIEGPPTAGSWKASTVYRLRVGTMNLSLPSNWQSAIGNRQSEGSWKGGSSLGPQSYGCHCGASRLMVPCNWLRIVLPSAVVRLYLT